MTPTASPNAHPDPWLNLLRGYVGETVRALVAGGLRPEVSWLDPRDPRDATIVLADSAALVWDEETGWRAGAYVFGEPGLRTELAGAAHLGGGVLVEPAELAGRVRDGVAEPRRVYRSRHDLHDGLDDRLNGY